MPAPGDKRRRGRVATYLLIDPNVSTIPLPLDRTRPPPISEAPALQGANGYTLAIVEGGGAVLTSPRLNVLFR